MLAQAALSPNKQSEEIAKIMFEDFKVPAICLAPQPLLSLFAARKNTGVVVDVGDGVTTFFPVYDGFVLTPFIHRNDVGGREVTKYLQLLLRKSGYIFSTSGEFEVVREIKESCCECLLPGVSQTAQNQPVNYTLPDGQTISVGFFDEKIQIDFYN